MKKYIYALFICAAMLFTACANTSEQPDSSRNSEPISEQAPTDPSGAPEHLNPQSDPQSDPQPEQQPVSITFTALGDNLIHGLIYTQAAQRAAGNPELRYDFSYAYAGAAELVGAADITVMNQETLICGEGYEPSHYPRFNSPVELGDYMKELGVDVFTIANNHCLDQGAAGLEDCLNYYDERGYIRTGVYHDAADRSNIRTIEINGVTVSFLCYTELLNGLVLPADSVLEIGMAYDTERVKAEIAAAKAISDVCVLSLHWGTEGVGETEDYQPALAREYGAAGADIILGASPHVLREIEVFENPDGTSTLCAYSLGNFISAQDVGVNLIGGALNFTVTVGEKTDISDVEFVPVVTHYGANFSDLRLYKLSDYTPELAAVHGVRAFSNFSYNMIYDYLDRRGLDKYMKDSSSTQVQ